jgi:hypothetical protein
MRGKMRRERFRSPPELHSSRYVLFLGGEDRANDAFSPAQSAETQSISLSPANQQAEKRLN